MPGPAAAKKRGKMTDCRVTRIYDLAIRRFCFLNCTHLWRTSGDDRRLELSSLSVAWVRVEPAADIT